jgi:transcriptional regulator of arginine metabolism
MDRQNRQQAIRDLVQANRYGTQLALLADLERMGWRVTQSSLSRDLVALNVIKQNGRYVLPQANGSAAARGLLSLTPAGDVLVVAKCLPGMASAIALEIDRSLLPMVVGTIAGDDTIFIAVAEARTLRAAIKGIWELFAPT